MTPITDLQVRGREIGQIRIGMVVQSTNGKPRPTKLDAFRFTTKSRSVAEAVAQLLGGDARESKLQNGELTYEVITPATELPVMVPSGDAVISQWYELWSAGGCQRRCDGKIETLTQSPCKCPVDKQMRNELAKSGGACKPTTRVNVILPDLPDLGVWRYESHGYYAAVELGGAAELLGNAREAGVIIPAKLRLEQRQTKRNGQTNKFAVVVLEIVASLRQMTELGSGGDIASALPPPPPQALQALASGRGYSDADDEPVEAELVETPAAPGWLRALYAELDAESRDELMARVKKANFPEPPPAAAERQVRRWVEEIQAEKAKGRPFE